MLPHSSDEAKLRHAEYMREYGRKRGATAVKGVLISCARCGKTTEKQHHAHDWCADCVRPAQNERKRARRAAAGSVVIGAQLTCKHCGAPFTKQHKRQFYCLPCSGLSAKSALPGPLQVKREYQNRKGKERRRLHPSFAIRERMSAQIGGALREKKAGRSWEAIVGYTLADLMQHLERQFLPGMTWENRAKWHIDHITPLATFTFTGPDDPEVRRAWGLPNLRPLWAPDNIKKREKRTHLL